jgi:hypothetical protein
VAGPNTSIISAIHNFNRDEIKHWFGKRARNGTGNYLREPT